jgi:pyruvate ferredoxin oxidoreductase beta subunit
MQFRKDLAKIVAGHNIPYVAQAAPSQWRDLMEKTRKAVNCGGPAFINVLASCNRGWRHPTDQTIEITQGAVDTCWWPLFEVKNGEWKLIYRPKEKRPVEQWLEKQGRFRHLFKPQNRHMIDEIQDEVDRRWADLLRLCGEA